MVDLLGYSVLFFFPEDHRFYGLYGILYRVVVPLVAFSCTQLFAFFNEFFRSLFVKITSFFISIPSDLVLFSPSRTK